MSNLVKPLGGGTLKPLMLEGDALQAEITRAKTLPQIRISSREAGDLFMMGIGGFTPLDGFMNQGDWQGVCDNYQLSNGVFWPIPVTLSTDNNTADALQIGADVALINSEDGDLVATMTISEIYAIDKTHECNTIYKTTDLAHPGVKMVMEQGDVNLAGSVKVLSLGGFPEQYGDQFMTPVQTRAEFDKRGWQKIAAFQTRNPMHRSHEYLVKVALETLDGALIHSTLGKLKEGDIPADVRSNAIQTLIDKYFVDNTVIQAGYPLDMRFAGPREALLHAAFRQNYGCSHLIVGRDHAGVGDYYGAFDAHDIFDKIPADALEIEPLRMDWTWWCDDCDGMSSMKTCPENHGDNGARLLLSGTKLRKALSEGEEVSTKFSRPEVLDILRAYYAGIKDEDKVEITMSGHSAQ